MDSDFLDDLEDLGAEEEEETMSVDAPNSLTEMTKTFHSSQMRALLVKIDELLLTKRNDFHNSGPVESDPEYHTIVLANTMTVEMQYEISLVEKMIKDTYAPRFPELESLILNPIDYATVVKLIGNETDMTKLDLKSHLPAASVMVITVTSTTTKGKLLSEMDLNLVIQACDLVIEMDQQRSKLLSYVQSRMAYIAPNLSILLGSATAAKVMGLAGGLTPLSRIPACNILVLGAQKVAMIGMSNISMGKHAGFIYECDLVVTTPNHVRRKAARLLSAKCALACRCDLSREYSDGRMGLQFRQDVQKKIALLVEPPPTKKIKALPLPIEHKTKRGGKRARAAKERIAPSDLQKAASRMAFGEQEQELMTSLGTSIGLGMIGGSTGKLKIQQKEFRVPQSKRFKAASSGYSTSSNPNSGLASSVALTPVKGIELENPDKAASKMKAINEKYFAAPIFKPKQL